MGIISAENSAPPVIFSCKDSIALKKGDVKNFFIGCIFQDKREKKKGTPHGMP